MLANLGQSCHLASALRCLFSLRRFSQIVSKPCSYSVADGLRPSGRWMLLLSTLWRAMRTNGPSAAGDVMLLFKAIAGDLVEHPSMAPRSRGERAARMPTIARQEDAHETMGVLLEAAGLVKLVEGASATKIVCDRCGAVKRLKDRFTFLTSVAGRSASGTAGSSFGDLTDGVGASLGRETVRGYDCDTCSGLLAPPASCSVKRRVTRFPDVLVVRCVWTEALSATVAPMFLDVSSLGRQGSSASSGSSVSAGSSASAGSSGSVGSAGCVSSAGGPGRYVLRSALIHTGTPEAGHYKAVEVARSETTSPRGGLHETRIRVTIHDDDNSSPAPPDWIARDSLERPVAVRVPGTQLHSAIYESLTA